MAKNQVQFQPGLSMSEFFDRYGSEPQCAQAPERARWPAGFRCPRCQGAAHCVLRGGTFKVFHLGASYPTAWLMHHKLMLAMAAREDRCVLCGDVPVDDAHLGGERTGGKRGRGSENKVPFVAAVPLTDAGHPLRVKLNPAPGFTLNAIADRTKTTRLPFTRKYPTRYPSAFACRFNRRFGLCTLNARLLVAAVCCAPQTERSIRMAEASC